MSDDTAQNTTRTRVDPPQGGLWQFSTLFVYLGLFAVGFTGVYDYLDLGSEADGAGWWLPLAVAPPLALGFSWRLPWSLAFPVLGGVILAAVNWHDDPLAAIFAIFLIPVAMLLVAVGRALAIGVGRRWGSNTMKRCAVVLFVIAAVPLVLSIYHATWPHAPKSVARLLPLNEDDGIANLCDGSVTPRARKVLQIKERQLAVTAHDHPNWIVSIERYSEDTGPYDDYITVRQLVREQLWFDDSGCEPGLRRALEAEA